MAGIKKNILGILTGTVAGVVFKTRKGNPYISSRPVNVIVSQTEKSVASRNLFSVVSPFCKEIARDFILKNLWDRSEVKGESARHKIMSVNVPKFHQGIPVENFNLIPGDLFFPAVLQSYSWENELFSFMVHPPDIPESAISYPNISAHGVIYLNDPVSPAEKQFKYVKVSSEYRKFRKDVPMEFLVHIDSDDRHTIEMYHSKKFILSLVLHNNNNVPVRGSENLII